jgi:hypothetical protein
MKTNFHFLPALACRATPRLSWVTRLWTATRPLFAVLCASLVCILAAPAARADGPAGEYKFVSSTGSISVGSASIPLPQKETRDKIAILRKGRIVIEDGKVLLDHKIAKLIIRRIFRSQGPGIAVDTTLKGPTYIPLHRNGQIYIGTTDVPLVVTLDGPVIKGDPLHGHWKNQFTAKVRGDTLKLTISMSGRFLGKKLSGIIVATCKRDTDL